MLNLEKYKKVLEILTDKESHFKNIDFPITAKAFEEGKLALQELILYIENLQTEEKSDAILHESNSSEVQME